MQIMTYHVLHLTTPNIKLYCDKGFFCCKYDDESENRLSLDDIRAIIVATHQVSFTNSCLAKLLEKNVVVLHCNNSYKPMGWTMGLDTVVRTKAFYNQISQKEEFQNLLWKKLLKCKINNQFECLNLIDANSSDVGRLAKRPLISEGNIAKAYWKEYFIKLGVQTKREHKNAENFENQCLNYGYAVLSTLLLRSVLIHGLSPNLGVHHKEKYDSIPLVYDLVEPFRSFVDFYLYRFKVNQGGDFKKKNHKAWCEYLAFCLKNYRLESNDKSYKIIDYIDILVEQVVNAFIDFSLENLNLPQIETQYLHIDKHKNREYEE